METPTPQKPETYWQHFLAKKGNKIVLAIELLVPALATYELFWGPKGYTGECIGVLIACGVFLATNLIGSYISWKRSK